MFSIAHPPSPSPTLSPLYYLRLPSLSPPSPLPTLPPIVYHSKESIVVLPVTLAVYIIGWSELLWWWCDRIESEMWGDHYYGCYDYSEAPILCSCNHCVDYMYTVSTSSILLITCLPHFCWCKKPKRTLGFAKWCLKKRIGFGMLWYNGLILYTSWYLIKKLIFEGTFLCWISLNDCLWCYDSKILLLFMAERNAVNIYQSMSNAWK